MKRTLKVIMALSLALCLILPCLIITAQGDGKIVVTIKNEAQKTFSGISINLCQIAAADAEGSFVFTDSFTGAGFNLPQRTDTETAEEAEGLYEYITANEISYTTIKTGSNGKSVFASLEDGIYLVFGNSGESVTFDPYLVFMPMYEDGKFVYDVESIPKLMEDSGGGGGGESDYSVSVTKVWDDDSNSANLRPSSVVVTLYRDGIAYKRVTLSESNSWKYTFTNLPMGSEYTVKEEDVESYTPSYSGDAETGYVIKNTYHKDEPTEPSSDTPTEEATNPTDEPTNPQEEPTEPQTEPQEYGHVTVTKKWSYSGTNRPTYVTVQLVENGVVVKTAVLSDENDWTYTFTGLPMTNTYTVVEIKPTGFAASYSGNASTGITITNRKKGGGSSDDDPTEPPTSSDDSTEPTTDSGDDSTEPSTGDDSTEPSTGGNGGGNDPTEPSTSGNNKPTEHSTKGGGEDDTSTEPERDKYIGGEEDEPTPTNPQREIETDETEIPSEITSEGEYIPDEPIIPQTGDNILICYVLCIAGAVLVVTGLLLFITGREKR